MARLTKHDVVSFRQLSGRVRSEIVGTKAGFDFHNPADSFQSV